MELKPIVWECYTDVYIWNTPFGKIELYDPRWAEYCEISLLPCDYSYGYKLPEFTFPNVEKAKIFCENRVWEYLWNMYANPDSLKWIERADKSYLRTPFGRYQANKTETGSFFIVEIPYKQKVDIEIGSFDDAYRYCRDDVFKRADLMTK